MTEPPPPSSALALSAVQFQKAQAAIAKAMVEATLRALQKFGMPTTDAARKQFATRLLPTMMRARQRSYDAAVAHMRYTAVAAGEPMPTPADIRTYGGWAIESVLERVENEKPDPTALDQVSRAAARKPDLQRTIAANMARHAQAAGRDAIEHTANDHGEEIGWARVLTGAENCAWCMMLASRGPVYRTQAKALYTGGETGNPFHNHCDCIATLVFLGKPWEGQADQERLEDLWAEVTKGHYGKKKFDAFRRHIDAENDAGADGDAEPDAAEWKKRQDALPVDFHGDVLAPHEVQFVERFLDAGEKLDWIPAAQSHTPTNDFIWTSNGNRPTELKSTKARYKTIHGRIVDAASRAAKQGVVKDNFVIDLGDESLTSELQSQLEGFNVGRRKYRLAGLWVMSRGALHQINLRT